jgi:hypothetical protein
LWESGIKQRQPLEKTIEYLMKELTKLNPQGHIHAIEMYAVINLIRRCPPGPLLVQLKNQPWSSFLGDLYFKYNDTAE